MFPISHQRYAMGRGIHFAQSKANSIDLPSINNNSINTLPFGSLERIHRRRLTPPPKDNQQEVSKLLKELNQLHHEAEDGEVERLKAENDLLKATLNAVEVEKAKLQNLAKDWEKVAKQASEMRKQDSTTHRMRLSDWENRCAFLKSENVELKKLCLYLDEQRQCILKAINSDNDDQGCGGCGGSSGSPSSNHYNGDESIYVGVDGGANPSSTLEVRPLPILLSRIEEESRSQMDMSSLIKGNRVSSSSAGSAYSSALSEMSLFQNNRWSSDTQQEEDLPPQMPLLTLAKISNRKSLMMMESVERSRIRIPVPAKESNSNINTYVTTL